MASPCAAFDSRHSGEAPRAEISPGRSTKRSCVLAASVREGGSHRPLALRSQSHPAGPQPFPHWAAAHARPPAPLICRAQSKPVNRCPLGRRAHNDIVFLALPPLEWLSSVRTRNSALLAPMTAAQADPDCGCSSAGQHPQCDPEPPYSTTPPSQQELRREKSMHARPTRHISSVSPVRHGPNGMAPNPSHVSQPTSSAAALPPCDKPHNDMTCCWCCWCC